jgi:hypothetical protein
MTYANVAATLALVFSMGAGAVAASHYVITSTSQIKPSVQRSLRAPVQAQVVNLLGFDALQVTRNRQVDETTNTLGERNADRVRADERLEGRLTKLCDAIHFVEQFVVPRGGSLEQALFEIWIKGC